MELQGHHIHFVCCGGIGMSALAAIALDKGAVVSGCDLNGGAMTASLLARGCTVHKEHSPAHLDGVELVVRSSAISESHPEITAALARHIPVVGRARMLARLVDGHRLIGVTGTHGKTTTTWLVGKLLLDAGLDPTIVVGGEVPDLHGNYRLGTGELFVAEVDESDRSHLEFAPFYSIVTNIDHDHVDNYPTLADLQAVFVRYLRRTAPDGCVIACADCQPLRETLATWGGHALTYGFAPDAAIRAENVRLEAERATFDAHTPHGVLRDLVLSLPGEHNVQNALAAVAIAYLLDLPEAVVRRAFGSLRGVGRRMEDKGTAAGVRFVDDYGHHPTEIRATAAAARPWLHNGGRLIGVFQPHRYTRTQGLSDQFGECFDGLDHLVVLPLYAAGEARIEGVSSDTIVRSVHERGHVPCLGFDGWDAARDHLIESLHAGDVVITLGAGSVVQFGEQLLAALRERKP